MKKNICITAIGVISVCSISLVIPKATINSLNKKFDQDFQFRAQIFSAPAEKTYSAREAQKGVIIKASTKTYIECKKGQNSFPLMSDDLANNTKNKFWIYQTENGKNSSVADMFVSPAEIEVNPEYTNASTLKVFEKDVEYFIMSDTDLVFQCGQGLSPVYECGNGIVEQSQSFKHLGLTHSTEECDDGNLVDNDGCSSSCTKELDARKLDSTTAIADVRSVSLDKSSQKLSIGRKTLGSFRFSPNKQSEASPQITDLIFTVIAQNVSFESYDESGTPSFLIYLQNDTSKPVLCDALLTNGTPIVARRFTGKAIIECNNIQMYEDASILDANNGLDISISGIISDTKLSNEKKSGVQVVFTKFSDASESVFGPMNSHIRWIDSAKSGSEFLWIDTVVSSIQTEMIGQ